MNSQDYQNLEFDRLPRIPRRLFWQAGLMIGLRLLWGVVPQAGLFWMMLLIVNVLGWMASYGWRMALLDFRMWLDQVTSEV